MAKTDQQRITDTTNLLQNTAFVHGPVQANAHQLAQDYLATINPMAPAFHQLSQSLSLGFHLLSDPNQQRRKARALFLLWKAMHHFDNNFTIPVQNIGQINQGAAQRLLTNYIYKACCLYETLHGGNVGAAHLLTQVFQPNPLQFLGDNKVFVAGSAALSAAQAPQNVQACKFEYNPHHDRYEFGVCAPVGNGAAPIQVESVTAFHWANARYVPGPPLAVGTANFNQMTGIELSGVHPMVTTQFTGCSFCMAEHGGNMYCAHVSPHVQGLLPTTTGNILAARIIATNGAFANAGNTVVRVYGRGLGHNPNPAGYNIGAGGGATTYMTIVGFPGGASYNIYAQTTRNGLISQVQQIY